MAENKVQVKPEVVGSDGTKVGGSPKGKWFNRGGFPRKTQQKFEGAVEELSTCIFDCQHEYHAKNFQ